MSYYNKEGNIVTIKTQTTFEVIIKFITVFIFGILLGFLGLFIVYAIIFSSLQTTEESDLVRSFLILLLVALPILLISFSNLRSFLESFEKLIYPKSVKLDVATKKFFINDSSCKFKRTINFEDFERIEHNMVFVCRGNDENGEPNINYYLKATATAKQVIIYFSDRTSYFDLLDLQYLSNYLGIPIIKNTIEMTYKDYNEFRKKELEDRKLETREMYFL